MDQASGGQPNCEFECGIRKMSLVWGRNFKWRRSQSLAAVVLLSAQVCAAHARPSPNRDRFDVVISPRESRLWHSRWQDQLEFAISQHTSISPKCEADRPPEALATPDPVLEVGKENLKITVSFIVGTDGLVHSPFILESGGTAEDHNILLTIQHWRYRPAMCNGVPTEVEAKIEFLSR